MMGWLGSIGGLKMQEQGEQNHYCSDYTHM